MNNTKSRFSWSKIKEDLGPILPPLILAVAIVGFSEYRRTTLESDFLISKTQSEQAQNELNKKINNLFSRIDGVANESAVLNNAVQNEKEKSTALLEQVGKVNDAAETLNKLSKTDKELLQKYSKVYFLNENYVPEKLVRIPQEFTYNTNGNYEIHTNVSPFLLGMMREAQASGVDISVISAYRSYGTQAQLKSRYTVVYGAGTANKFSADQGYSEHQLGTTVDFTTKGISGAFEGFDKTPAYAWLTQNAYKYGFILSYPSGNKFYEYEPWHWRFVGVDLATRLHRDGKNFYDVDQRFINDYLSVIFN